MDENGPLWSICDFFLKRLWEQYKQYKLALMKIAQILVGTAGTRWAPKATCRRPHSQIQGSYWGPNVVNQVRLETIWIQYESDTMWHRRSNLLNRMVEVRSGEQDPNLEIKPTKMTDPERQRCVCLHCGTTRPSGLISKIGHRRCLV